MDIRLPSARRRVAVAHRNDRLAVNQSNVLKKAGAATDAPGKAGIDIPTATAINAAQPANVKIIPFLIPI